MRLSRQLTKQIRKAENDLIIAGDKYLDLVMCSSALALNRYWGWKEDRLNKLSAIQEEVWNEVGSDNDKSMLKLLDEECNIELTNHEGVSYRDVIYLNTDIDPGKDLDPYQYLAMRLRQKDWIEAQITACVCLAMHRKEGWGFKRVKELMERMQEIKEEFDYDEKAVIAAALKEAHYDWIGIQEEKKDK